MVFERSRRKRMVDIQQLPNSGPFHVTAKVDLEHIVNLTGEHANCIRIPHCL